MERLKDENMILFGLLDFPKFPILNISLLLIIGNLLVMYPMLLDIVSTPNFDMKILNDIDVPLNYFWDVPTLILAFSIINTLHFRRTANFFRKSGNITDADELYKMVDTALKTSISMFLLLTYYLMIIAINILVGSILVITAGLYASS